MGLPVVGWRAGNLPYLAEDEREGLLLELGDVEALSQALLRLARDQMSGRVSGRRQACPCARDVGVRRGTASLRDDPGIPKRERLARRVTEAQVAAWQRRGTQLSRPAPTLLAAGGLSYAMTGRAKPWRSSSAYAHGLRTSLRRQRRRAGQ